MEIILKVNELGFEPFLDNPVDSFIVGLKGFSINQNFVLSLSKLPDCIKKIKDKNKKIYLNINCFALEKDIKKFKKLVNKLLDLEIDGFIVSDLGMLNIFKSLSKENKVILDLHTYITNKYSAKSLIDLGINRLCVAKEITLEDIKEISAFTNGKLEIQCQGYYPITHSKRPILDTYYENFKLNKKTNIHYIKEETRDAYYCLTQDKNSLTVYYDKEYSVFPYLNDLVQSNVNSFRIDANFLDEETIKEYINFYSNALNLIENNNSKEYEILKEEFLTKYKFENPFMHNKSFLLKEGK